MKVAVLAGGVGGARLSSGFDRALPAADLSVIVNTGDDFDHLGLRICPDLDTVMYTLAGLANRDLGWGIAGDTFNALEALQRVGGPAWFRLGDRDLATHLQRTSLLAQGMSLTEVTRELSDALGVQARVLPMTDGAVATKVLTDEGELDFQDYFVRRRCEPAVRSIHFAGIEGARPSSEVLAALDAADGIVIAPSNPFVSVEPILALPGVRDALRWKPAVAVSPIVGGQAIKGPAAKMLRELRQEVSALGVARRYAGLVGGYVLDELDTALAREIEALGFRALATKTIMRSDEDREGLARDCLELLQRLTPASVTGR